MQLLKLSTYHIWCRHVIQKDNLVRHWIYFLMYLSQFFCFLLMKTILFLVYIFMVSPCTSLQFHHLRSLDYLQPIDLTFLEMIPKLKNVVMRFRPFISISMNFFLSINCAALPICSQSLMKIFPNFIDHFKISNYHYLNVSKIQKGVTFYCNSFFLSSTLWNLCYLVFQSL